MEGVHRPKMLRAFFNWFYWCVNISSFIALGALGYVQQEISFFWGYVAPAASLIVALIVFIVGKKQQMESMSNRECSHGGYYLDYYPDALSVKIL